MKNTRRALLIASALVALPMVQGCATKIKAASVHNPAPTAAFASYARIELKPVVYKAGYRGNPALLAKIGANLEKDLATSLQQWNSGPANGRTLTIEPVVEEMSFKGATSRVFLGPLAGSSGVLMRVTFRDQAGTIVARPEFFQRASAMGAGFAMGVNDNMMLTRVAKLASSYIVSNYAQPVGGPTGADEQAVAAK